MKFQLSKSMPQMLLKTRWILKTHEKRRSEDLLPTAGMPRGQSVAAVFIINCCIAWCHRWTLCIGRGRIALLNANSNNSNWNSIPTILVKYFVNTIHLCASKIQIKFFQFRFDCKDHLECFNRRNSSLKQLYTHTQSVKLFAPSLIHSDVHSIACCCFDRFILPSSTHSFRFLALSLIHFRSITLHSTRHSLNQRQEWQKYTTTVHSLICIPRTKHSINLFIILWRSRDWVDARMLSREHSEIIVFSAACSTTNILYYCGQTCC